MLTTDDFRAALASHSPHDIAEFDGMTRAAVAAILRQGRGGVEILFIHRAEDPRDPWSGHMAFPGGRVDPGDDSRLAAAIRETREEVGLDLEDLGERIGRLSDVQAIGRGRPLSMVITPFVFAVSSVSELVTNHEVDEVSGFRWRFSPIVATGRAWTTGERTFRSSFPAIVTAAISSGD